MLQGAFELASIAIDQPTALAFIGEAEYNIT